MTTKKLWIAFITHHLYFTGTPTAIKALGATFSALEVVPLVLMSFEAWDNVKLSRSQRG